MVAEVSRSWSSAQSARRSLRTILAKWFCVLLVSGSLPAGVRAYDDDVEKWVELPDRLAIDMSEIGRWIDAGLARIEWRVYLKDGQVRAVLTSETSGLVSPPPEFAPRAGEYQFASRDTYMRTEDGWLVSFRRGEWGGALYWFSPDGKSNQYLGGQQVNQFLQMGDRILAVEGLSHMGLSNGSLIELSRSMDDGKWRYETAKLLPETPYAFARLSDESLLIVLLNSVVSLTSDGRLTTVMRFRHFAGGVANSLALMPASRKAFLGRRLYVTELDFSEQRVRYLVPAQVLRQLLSPGKERGPEPDSPTPMRFRPPAPDPSLQ
jgi:hypothetical protein